MPRSRKAIIGVLIFSALFLVLAGWTSYLLYPVAYHSDQFKINVSKQDSEKARREFNEMMLAYKTVEKYRLKWLANRYLLEDAFLYEPALHLVDDHDYDRVINDLEKYKDDYRAAHLIGVAKVRKAQSDYAFEKDPKVKIGIMKEMMKEVSPYFKNAVKGSSFNFDDALNYDIVSNEDSAKNLLENKKPPLVRLGYEPKGKEPGAPQKKETEKPKLDEEKKDPGSGGLGKRG
ncbi:MAG: hypothetical protein A2817_00220 [Candidatus Yanofskybacteria bacterium RIFCSPHIGHO2_01_FULL_39_8b]|uniref:Uncharacterized protein n=1 Tax=Candidatus Yanofskybacteria bacterium RIFCSPHIGHO2_01_FULL_39_8b TaxID=1802659 RepID=A0A1F8ED53_9BACT|nr:MAG: hypothetical protein A2817_00220 [Candidatus Yanofskybacteria bacterium RIFCSPHIGHO2_01_FULL_39_8b]